MSDNPVNEEVKTFEKSNLKRTTTDEKNYMPTKADIDQEKQALKEGNNGQASCTGSSST